MRSRKILTIAANPDLRRSVAFALRAEGHTVTSREAIVAVDEGRGYDCVVLDHRVARIMPRDLLIEFFSLSPNIVLLAGQPDPGLASRAFRVVETPQLGGNLSAAVAAAVSHPSPGALAELQAS